MDTPKFSCATSDIGTGTYTIMAQVAAEMLGLPIEKHQHKTRRFLASSITVEGWLVDCGVSLARDHRDSGRSPQELLDAAKEMKNSPLANAKPDDVMLSNGKIVSKKDPPSRYRSLTQCATVRWIASRKKSYIYSKRKSDMRTIRTRPFSLK